MAVPYRCRTADGKRRSKKGKSPGAWPQGFFVVGSTAARSVPRDDRAGSCREVIVDAGADDVVGDARIQRCTEADTSSGREHRSAADRAEVHIQIFDLGAPVAGEHRLDAATNGPAEAGIAARSRDRDRSAVRGEAGEPQVGLERAVGCATGGVEQDVWHDRNADAATEGAEPFKLLIECGRGAKRTRRDEGQAGKAARGCRRAQGAHAAALTGPLRVGLES